MEQTLEFTLNWDEYPLNDAHLARLLHAVYHILIASPYVGEQMRTAFFGPLW